MHIDSKNDPAEFDRYEVVCKYSFVEIPGVVWADDEAGEVDDQGHPKGGRYGVQAKVYVDSYGTPMPDQKSAAAQQCQHRMEVVVVHAEIAIVRRTKPKPGPRAWEKFNAPPKSKPILVGDEDDGVTVITHS